MELLKNYLQSNQGKFNPEMIAFVANLDLVAKADVSIAKSIVKEFVDQRSHLKLVASENFCSFSVQAAMGNLLTDKYAEGYPGNRFYAGCDNVDNIERFAIEEAKKLFGCEHAFVQPHSGADANLVAFWAILRKKVQEPIMERLGYTDLLAISKNEWDEIRSAMGNQKMLGMDLFSGGHLTHGYRHNASAQMFDSYYYSVNKDTGLIEYEEIRNQLHEIKPLVLLAGYSAYTRSIDFSVMRKLADEVGAVLMVDMAHFAGLVAGGVMSGVYNPVPYADIVTTTTHKSLRGPRGGLVLCMSEYAEHVDKACPYIMGGPLPHVMAAKAIALKEANTDEFKTYAKKILENSTELAKALVERGIEVVTGGTDNHIVLVNVGGLELTGRQAENALRECRLTLNRNTVPFDKNGPWYTSGLRFGTCAVTTLGMGKDEMTEIADVIAKVLKNTHAEVSSKGARKKAAYKLDDSVREESIKRVKALMVKFVLYPQIDLEFLSKHLA